MLFFFPREGTARIIKSSNSERAATSVVLSTAALYASKRLQIFEMKVLFFSLDQNLGLLSERVAGDKSTHLRERREWSEGEEANVPRLKSCKCVSMQTHLSLLPTGFPWRRLGRQVPRPVHQPRSWHLHAHHWGWIMLMRADFSAVLTGSSFPLFAAECFLVKWVLSNGQPWPEKW